MLMEGLAPSADTGSELEDPPGLPTTRVHLHEACGLSCGMGAKRVTPDSTGDHTPCSDEPRLGKPRSRAWR
jgi:hypothetical protein